MRNERQGFVCLVLGVGCLALGAWCPPQARADSLRTETNSSVIRSVSLETQFVVCGGGLAGVCAAVSAARHGARVVLVQDRPVLGGNASSEMRMGIVGAHGKDNAEAGLLEEMQLENFYRNPLQRYTLWDDVIYSTVVREKNITMLLNTSVEDVVMEDARIAAVKAWNSNNYTRYEIRGTLFADCTGDGILRLSGAKFRRGRELPGEFGEDYLTNGGGDHRTMGNSILLQLRKTAEDHPFVAPEWAYHFTDKDFDCAKTASADPKIVRYNYKRLYPENNNFWWIEFGGNLDTIGDAGAIRHELKRIAYGVWEYMKNHPDGCCKYYDLDWIGSLPGKRESTRFMGPHVLTQGDILSGGHFEDVVAYGGWTLDDHDPDAFHKNGKVSTEYRTPSPFGIPFDCLYSVNVPNLMFAGRDISATHMGLSATRVMATCAMLGQAVGTAAAIAIRTKETPAGVRKNHLPELQATLEDDDQMLPYRWRKPNALTVSARTDPANEPLRNGIDRCWQEADNGVWVATNAASIAYSWTKPVTLCGARLVFDSDLKPRGKRMRKLEATTERVSMPTMLTKAFRLEARVGDKWKTVCDERENYRRLRQIRFSPVTADALRLVVTETWGGEKAHVFAFDAIGVTWHGGARTDFLHLSHVHRGGGKKEAPDNTLETFTWCWSHGSAVECDCRRTKDGVGIMLHDDFLKRTGRGISVELATNSVSCALTWNQIRDVDVGLYQGARFKGQRIPTIEATFGAMKGHPTFLAMVDEKGAGPLYIAEKARAAGVQDQVYYTGSKYANIVKWNEILPGGKSLLWIGAFPKERTSRTRRRVRDHFETVMRELRAADFKFVTCVSIHTYYDPSDPVDPFILGTAYLKSLIDEFHAHGVIVCSIPFEGGEREETYFKLWELGCDGFSTDYPSVMFEVIRKLKEKVAHR